jgi:flavin reductase
MPTTTDEHDVSRPCTPMNYKSALRKVPAAVAIIAARHDGQIRGMTATAICSVSAEPPMILACVHQDARSRSVISAAGRFSINFLSDGQRAVAQRFSQPELSGNERFGSARWNFECRGAPMLDGSLAFFGCDIVHEATHGTHHVFIATVTDVKTAHGEPLLYLDGSYRKIAGLCDSMAAG